MENVSLIIGVLSKFVEFTAGAYCPFSMLLWNFFGNLYCFSRVRVVPMAFLFGVTEFSRAGTRCEIIRLLRLYTR